VFSSTKNSMGSGLLYIPTCYIRSREATRVRNANSADFLTYMITCAVNVVNAKSVFRKMKHEIMTRERSQIGV
jgi:hypothetical protein